MSTTGIVLSLTDEQLKDIDEYCEMTQHIESGEQACVSLYELRGLLEELRRLRAENAELAKDAGRYEWTLHQAWFQSAFERYDPEDDGTQGLFESECRKITDIVMCR